MAHGHDNHNNSKLHYHSVPFSTYINVFSALIVLTVITVWAAQYHFGAFNTIIAMAIATTKATLVLAFFMHLKYDGLLNRVVVLTGLFFLFVLFIFTYMDHQTRVLFHNVL